MIRIRFQWRIPQLRIPRESGDDPDRGLWFKAQLEYSPRERG